MINYKLLKAWPIPEVRQTYETRDTILYALGIGCGFDPTDRDELAYVYENGLRAFPSMALVLGYPGFWLSDPATGVDWKRVLHGEQELILHRPLPASATVIGKSRVIEIYDKGAGRDALIISARDVLDDATGDLMATLTSTVVLRGAGGFGGVAAPQSKAAQLPDRRADHVVDIALSPQAAMIYRLSGDLNPLHIDYGVAETAGFARPILHGLCTFGIATRALVRTLCESAPEGLGGVAARFSAPVYPGETLQTEIWLDGTAAQFRCRIPERDTVVLANGVARLR